MTTPSQRIPKPRPRAASSRQPKKILTPEQIFNLDQIASALRFKLKQAASKKQWGKNWQNCVRSGRKFTRVERIEPITAEGEVSYVLRPEPGWEWVCQNCHTRSLVTESMIAVYRIDGKEYRDDMLKQWEALAASTVAGGFRPPAKPTPETAGCPNCKFRPGDPE